MIYAPKIAQENNYYGVPVEAVSWEDRERKSMMNQSSANSLPVILTEFGSISSWSTVTTAQFKKQLGSNPTQNLYFDDFQLNRHDINAFLRDAQKALSPQQFFAFKFITSENNKNILQSVLPPFLFLFYYPWFFFFRRVLPKLKGFRKISRQLHNSGEMSKAEIMGRLIYNGFEIVSLLQNNREILLVAKINPTNNPSLLKPEPSEGFIFKTQRMGTNGTPLTLYKFRSMHPYAEYVQEFIHQHNGLEAGGKFKNDFRVSTGGRVIRKYWIDELPMLFNLLKGDLKLIGVRPISTHYFGLYPPNLQNLRIKHKPGLLPPFYADLPQTFDEIVQSEIKYLTAYEKAPFKTDWHYFVQIIKNIFIHKARSQ
ncbi:MAG: sugar transferase [Cytophagia bacterium]|nr:MAG: sugar transferase [Cytophagales bacterium]TAG35325.1 MAG: sugar transferase [Cytophagia bacterium]TAG77224.1 MAG: sugar transferase [Cytophagales bacterium]